MGVRSFESVRTPKKNSRGHVVRCVNKQAQAIDSKRATMDKQGDGDQHGGGNRKCQLPSSLRAPQHSGAKQQDYDDDGKPTTRPRLLNESASTSNVGLRPAREERSSATADAVSSTSNTPLVNPNPLVVSQFATGAPTAGSGSACLPAPQPPPARNVTACDALESMRQFLGNPATLQQQPVLDPSQVNAFNLSHAALAYQEHQLNQQRLLELAALQSANLLAASNPSLSLASSNRNAAMLPPSLYLFLNASANTFTSLPRMALAMPAATAGLPIGQGIPPPSQQQQMFMNSLAALDSLRQAPLAATGAAAASSLVGPDLALATSSSLSATGRHLLSSQLQPPLYQGPPRTANLFMEISDKETLSDHQVLLRKQIEYFEATLEDVRFFCPSRRHKVTVGQVGLRCKNCSAAGVQPTDRKKGCVYFPASLRALYQAAQNMGTTHLLGNCEHISAEVHQRLQEYTDAPARAGYGGKKYWAQSARNRGIYETEQGLRFHDFVN